VKAQRGFHPVLHGALLALLAVYSIFPIYMVTIESLKSVDEDVFGSPFYVRHPSFEWYENLFERQEWVTHAALTTHTVPFLVWTKNTVIVFTAALAVILTTSLAAGYALGRLRLPGWRLWRRARGRSSGFASADRSGSAAGRCRASTRALVCRAHRAAGHPARAGHLRP